MKFGTLVAVLKSESHQPPHTPRPGRCSSGESSLDARGRTNMTVSNWTEADSNRAQQIWSDYQHHHDLSEKAGQTAGIDPASGRIWFGQSIQDVIAQRDAAASEAPLFFVRVGSTTYYRKGGPR
jgi:hypothetical protein